MHIDGAALAWTLLIAVVSAMLFGLAPGFRMAAGNLHEALKDSSAGSGQSRKHERLRSVLVISEVALACMLLVGAGLLLRSFLKSSMSTSASSPSARRPSLWIMTTLRPLATATRRSPPRRFLTRAPRIFQQLLERVGALPGVQAAGISDYLPLSGNRSWGLPFPKGVTQPKNLHVSGPLVYVVSPGYLRAMGTQIRGRDFTWSDRTGAQTVVIIDQGFAKFLDSYAHWPNNNPVGHLLDDGSKAGLLIVGVTADVHAESVEGENGWQIYYPWAQAFGGTPQLVIRTTLPPAQLASGVMSVLRQANPNQSATEFKPIQTLVDHANSPRRFFMMLVLAFAGLGMLLAALGIYGVISYSVTRQTQEIGIRMALGASASHVRKRILLSTLRLAAIGVVLGAAVSVMTARLVASLLYATSPWDAATYIGMAVALMAVAAVAGYVPALRASRIDPLVALRSE